ncbi:MAG: OsmC family protein [Kiritimatiellales bacterium]|nr:OsmC family protein [Kiritimatiellota bacterium]MBL7012358.1 OsmC family protein [Kiritimatiellales bacterium]
MAMKTVKVESTLDSKFKIESDIRGHKIVVDQPANAGGTDTGPTPLEYLMVSLAGCIGTIGRIVAMQTKLEIRGMKITAEGDLNVDGLLGKPTEDPVGFKEFRILVDIDADMTAEEKDAFIHAVDARCPVSWNLLNVSKVTVSAV